MYVFFSITSSSFIYNHLDLSNASSSFHEYGIWLSHCAVCNRTAGWWGTAKMESIKDIYLSIPFDRGVQTTGCTWRRSNIRAIGYQPHSSNHNKAVTWWQQDWSIYPGHVDQSIPPDVCNTDTLSSLVLLFPCHVAFSDNVLTPL